jgi:hypothetical protein
MKRVKVKHPEKKQGEQQVKGLPVVNQKGKPTTKNGKFNKPFKRSDV